MKLFGRKPEAPLSEEVTIHVAVQAKIAPWCAPGCAHATVKRGVQAELGIMRPDEFAELGHFAVRVNCDGGQPTEDVCQAELVIHPHDKAGQLMWHTDLQASDLVDLPSPAEIAIVQTEIHPQ